MGPPDVGQNDNFGEYNMLIDDDCDCCDGCGWPLLCSDKQPISAVAPMAPGDNRRDDGTLSSASDNVIAAAD